MPTRPAAHCPRFGPGREHYIVNDPRLTEISGLAFGHHRSDLLYCHNDSGDTARVLAIDDSGVQLVLDLPGQEVFDAEDMALMVDPGGTSWLYLADTGDNRQRRHAGVFVLRIPEPEPGGPALKMAQVEQVHIRYPRRAHDTEALLVDPLTTDMFVITKGRDGHNHVFRVPGDSFASGHARAEDAGDLHLGLVTAADITPDGRLIIVRTYTDAWLWERAPGASVAEALQGPACELPLSAEGQGESIAWARDGDGYYSISEGLGQPLYFYPRLDRSRLGRGDTPSLSTASRL